MPPETHKLDCKQTKKEIDAYESCLLASQTHQRQVALNVIAAFKTKEERDEFIKKLEETFFSKDKTEHIKNLFDNFNEDSLKNNINIVSEIIEGEEHIDYFEHQNTGFFTKIANSIHK